MSIYYRHFRVTGGALVARLHELKAAKEAAMSQYTALRDEVGADNVHAWGDGSFAGFSFKNPDRNLYREARGAWLPKKNSLEGKAIWEKIKKLPRVPGAQHALEVAGLGGDVPCLFGDGYAWRATLCGFYDRDIWFVKVPWKDEDPAAIEKYKADNAAGTHYSADMEHLLWQPPTDWQEIKEWQFLKEWEELDQKAA